MRSLLWVIALFALAVGAALAAHFNEGYLLLVMPPYRVELSLNFAVVLALAGFLLIYVVLRAIALTRSLPQRVREYRRRRQDERMLATFGEAIRLLFEGRYSQSMKKAAEAHAAGHLPALAGLIAARAAQRLRDGERLEAWRARAQEADPRTRAAGLMLAAEMQLEVQDFEAAARTIRDLQAVAGRHLAALRLDLRAQQGLANWDEVLRLVRQLDKHDALAPGAVEEIRERAHRAALRTRQGDASRLEAYWRAMPEAERSDRLTGDYARAQLAAGAGVAAQMAIETALARAWVPELVALYGEILGGDVAARLALAESWRAGPDRGADPTLALTLARLCLMQGRADAAQPFLDRAAAAGETADIALERARAADMQGESEAALAHFRRAAALAQEKPLERRHPGYPAELPPS